MQPRALNIATNQNLTTPWNKYFLLIASRISLADSWRPSSLFTTRRPDLFRREFTHKSGEYFAGDSERIRTRIGRRCWFIDQRKQLRFVSVYIYFILFVYQFFYFMYHSYKLKVFSIWLIFSCLNEWKWIVNDEKLVISFTWEWMNHHPRVILEPDQSCTVSAYRYARPSTSKISLPKTIKSWLQCPNSIPKSYPADLQSLDRLLTKSHSISFLLSYALFGSFFY
jgi:hypothetical protein